MGDVERPIVERFDRGERDTMFKQDFEVKIMQMNARLAPEFEEASKALDVNPELFQPKATND